MRIDAYNQVSQLYQAQQTVRSDKQNKTAAKDQIQISRTAKEHQIARKAVAESPDVREDLVASIKARMDAGTYEVSNADFAQALIDRYNNQQLSF